MNWPYLIVCLGMAILLPSQSAANCTLFAQLYELDRLARSYLAAEAEEERQRQLSMISASDAAEHLLEDPDSGDLVPFLEVRRDLARAGRPARTDGARDDLLARMHQTREDLVRYAETWDCLSGNGERADPAARDVHRRAVARASDHPDDGAAESDSPAIAWARFLVLGVWLAPAGMILWEMRRSSMRERHSCRCPCVLSSKPAVARAEVVDISRTGAKIRISGFPIPVGDTVDVTIEERRIRMTIAWKSEHFLGGRFKRAIPRRMVKGVSSGVQLRYGPAARGQASRTWQDAALAPAGEADPMILRDQNPRPQ